MIHLQNTASLLDAFTSTYENLYEWEEAASEGACAPHRLTAWAWPCLRRIYVVSAGRHHSPLGYGRKF